MYVVAERLKKRAYSGIYGTFRFWRTYDGQEIDYAEERDGGLFGFECKWSSKQRSKPPKKWREAYPGATFELVTRRITILISQDRNRLPCQLSIGQLNAIPTSHGLDFD